MRDTSARWTRYVVPALLMVVVAALAVAAPASAAPPPTDRSYEVTFVIPEIGDDPEEDVTECLAFTRDEACGTGLAECAPWIFTPVEGDKRPGFKTIIRFINEDGAPIELHIRGFTERRGEPVGSSSIGGVVAGVITQEGMRGVFNFGFVGREVTDCSGFEGTTE